MKRFWSLGLDVAMGAATALPEHADEVVVLDSINRGPIPCVPRFGPEECPACEAGIPKRERFGRKYGKLLADGAVVYAAPRARSFDDIARFVAAVAPGSPEMIAALRASNGDHVAPHHRSRSDRGRNPPLAREDLFADRPADQEHHHGGRGGRGGGLAPPGLRPVRSRLGGARRPSPVEPRLGDLFVQLAKPFALTTYQLSRRP